jgi:hypothetical protein
MSKFKVGDIVIPIQIKSSPKWSILMHDCVEQKSRCIVIKCLGDNMYEIQPIDQYNKWLVSSLPNYFFHGEDLTPRCPINSLNKLLYPDYVEYEGYLISKEAYETLTHQKK